MSRFFKGVSLEQDRRFTNKDQKLAKKVNFPAELDQVIDIKNKVKFEVLRPWITRTTIELLGLEDDVFITYVIELLQKNEEARPRELHVSVTPFLGLENASKFCEELWKLLISAQQSEFGIPSQFLEVRKAQLAQQQAAALARQRELDALRNKVTVELAAREAQRLQQVRTTTITTTTTTTTPSVAPHHAKPPQQPQPKQALPPVPPPAPVQVPSADVGAASAVVPSSRGSDTANLPNMASLVASTQVASSGWDAPTGVIMRADREERRKRRREQQEQRRRGHDGDQEDHRHRSREMDDDRSRHRASGSGRRHESSKHRHSPSPAHSRSHRRHRSRSPDRRRHQRRSRSSSRSPSRHRRRHRSRSRSRSRHEDHHHDEKESGHHDDESHRRRHRRTERNEKKAEDSEETNRDRRCRDDHAVSNDSGARSESSQAHSEAYDSLVAGKPETQRTASCSPPASVYDLP